MYVDDLFKIAVGAIGFSPDCFYSSQPREVLLAIEGFTDNKKRDFFLTQTATINAVGVFFGGKSFKVNNPFEDKIKKEIEVTAESKAETFDYLHNKFNN